MKKSQLLIVVFTAFYMNFLYANPAEEVKYTKEINNRLNQSDCLLKTSKEKLEFNDQNKNTLDSQNILVYDCSAKVLPTVSFTSPNNLNQLNNEGFIPYPDVNLNIEEAPEYKNTVVVTVTF
ncbi:hypothetical protein [Acinetobacter pittii]|uniref:Uncharacterized protein n=1 Tax=Acinetobacter pittii TaxID=48296 RepID=A0A6H0FTB9_ACIPI|nr:hypothetical protein [Acinetobacter pittii]AUM25948.1 hypothetical protein BVD86_03075 [Acinetobacter pittii]MBN6526632.1 hypothetical protein [Acinetobacter pittii]MBN6535991.1 hypothetical protein [Acinetobacter pittii]OCY38074.1 hypothetical protein BFR77_15145 [Acinetobacter pittii]QIT17617.1 hypothetical protein G8E09_07750 [Acinetobacter pittii]